MRWYVCKGREDIRKNIKKTLKNTNIPASFFIKNLYEPENFINRINIRTYLRQNNFEFDSCKFFLKGVI